MAGNPLRILYVEDHIPFASRVCQLFLPGHRVTVVPGILAARAALEAASFDLVLVDFDLLDGKGNVVVREVLERLPGMPIIAVSSHEPGNQALVAAGAVAICSKPEIAILGQVIDRVMATRAG